MPKEGQSFGWQRRTTHRADADSLCNGRTWGPWDLRLHSTLLLHKDNLTYT